MAAKGGRKGCFVFPTHSSQGGKSGPRGAACHVQPHKGALAKTGGPPWRGPTRGWEAALSPVGSCLWLSISPRTASCRSGPLEGGWQLASLVFPLLPVTSSLLSRAWQSRGEGPWEEQTQDALSEAQPRNWLTQCTHRTLWSQSSEPFLYTREPSPQSRKLQMESRERGSGPSRSSFPGRSSAGLPLAVQPSSSAGCPRG